MSSNPTNPEQVDCQWCNGTGDCFNCNATGKVAANVNTTDAQAKLNVNAAAKPDECPECKKLGWKCEEHDPFYGTAPAPVDQPDELEQRLQQAFDDIYRYGGTGKAGARIVMDMYEPIIAREREAAAKEARIAELEWIHGQFLGDQPVIDVVAARHAALTKGEAK